MKTLIVYLRALVALALFWCLNAYGITGPETAQLLNNRYQSTVPQCAVNKPAWACSGVLVLASPRDPGKTFWEHGALATALGAEDLVYLRTDLGIRELAQPNGVVLSDLFTAVGDGKSLEVLCSYPFTPGLDSTRQNFGCALPTASASQAADLSSCPATVTDANTWLAHFQNAGNQPAQQCSLSILDPALFKASLEAHQGLGNDWSIKANELLIRNWDPTAASSIPVQALTYDANTSGGLLASQLDQRAWFDATGQWLPILRMNLNDNSAKVFGFNLQDQLYVGYDVAARMNSRFRNTSALCGDNAAFYCNGVLIRGTQASAAFHAWNPSQNSVSRNGVSFSYVRADEGTTTLVGTHGFTMKESFAPALHPITLRCAYPVNAATSAIPDSCRASCEQQGVTTVDAWRARYAGAPQNSCAFTASPAQFQLHIDVRTVLSAANRVTWNEIIIAAWPQNIPTQLPLESFFYTTAAGRGPAQFMQRDYATTTGRFLPVIQMTLTNAQPFTYYPADQLAAGKPGLKVLNLDEAPPP